MSLWFIDKYLNLITMYRLLMYGLLLLAGISIIFGFFHILPYSGIQFGITLALLISFCYGSNWIFAKLFHATTNSESYMITSLILFFILAPVLNLQDGIVTITAAIIAMASKYLLAIGKKHIFNPTAISVFLLGLFGFGNGIWWVGSTVLLPLVLVFGLLVVRKIRRFHLFLSFLITAVVTNVLFNLTLHVSIIDSLQFIFLSGPIIFFGTIMLTEPLTTPPRKQLQMAYGGLVGILFGSQFQFGPIHATPELALIIGNLYSYIVSPKQKLFLKLQEVKKLAPQIYEFVFSTPEKFQFIAGQYLEWTLSGFKADLRGNRRYFTVASAPTDNMIRLGVKVTENHPSAFKKKLLTLKPGDQIVAGSLSGDFVLPKDQNKKLVFISGGIGVTPFRSIISNLIDKKEKRDIILFYTASTKDEFVYQDVLSNAQKELGVKTIWVITNLDSVPSNWPGEKGRLTPEIIKKYVPDFATRTFYLSGPNAMVEGYKKLLHDMGISQNHIVTDYFPGF